jgi:O-methyltransferase domain
MLSDDGREPEELAARMVSDLAGFIITQTLGVVADLGVADVVGDEPAHVDDLAAAVGANADALFRALRALASLGYFTETAPRVFAHTPLSRLLREDDPGSLRHYARWTAGDAYKAWSGFGDVIRSGLPAFERVFGAPLFDYLTEHDASREVFNKGMSGTAAARLEVLLAEDWSDVKQLVDVGGGRGTLVAAMLDHYPAMQGIVFDLPAVADEAARNLSERGLDARSQVRGGDFFTEVPAGGDLYVLSQILHDWSDDESIAILRACRAAIPEHGRLVLIEQIVPPGDEPSYAKLLDLQMLVLLTGRERTENEWRELLATSGFTLQRIVTRVRSCLLEARPTVAPG